jgi:preprotein translocase SecE subunit
VARNRKRAKERRARRPQPVASRRANVDEAPDPIAHATPDVELAEAQLAVGRPELQSEEDERGYAEAAEELEELEELEPEPEPVGAGGGGDRVRTGAGFDGDPVGPIGGAGGAAAAALPHPGSRVEPRVGLVARLIGFLQGSWRELQRVQWPDRRQVAQATSVVIGFVIIAGVFLGLADLAFSHLMNYVLYGK